MTFHVVAMPHAPIVKPDAWSAASPYVQVVRGFCEMMHGRGHTVYLYGPNEATDAPCTEFVPCFSAADQGKHCRRLDHDASAHCWRWMNTSAAAAIERRREKNDVLCLIYGTCQERIARILKMRTVEIAVGYKGICRTVPTHRVFPSRAWQHYIYGAYQFSDGCLGDAVIPHFFEPRDFTRADPADYFLYLGRMVPDKGVAVAAAACVAAGAPLLMAGEGPCRPTGQGIVDLQRLDVRQRTTCLSTARAVFALTQYIGPFESTHVEAMLSGVPVITTDWGVFTETVVNGFNGYRVRNIEEIATAMRAVETLDRRAIQEWAVERFSLARVAPQYEEYFERLQRAA